MPKVSVLMTTYNRAKYLTRAVDSIVAQSYLNWELIIIDDASNDGTEEIIRLHYGGDERIKYFKNENNLGIVKSRNLALSKCAGELVAVLDSDDVWADRDKLRKQIDFLENNPNHILCGCQARIIDENDRDTGGINHAFDDMDIRKAILSRNQFVHSSVVYSKRAAMSVGGYGGYQIGEDYDLFLKLGQKGKFANLSDTMVHYRRHSAGITRKNKDLSAREHLKIIRKYKGLYPNYCPAVIKAYLRIIFAYLRFI